MYILQSWRDSIGFFKPASLRLFVLVTLKTIIRSYHTIITKLWPFLILWAAAEAICLAGIVPPDMRRALYFGLDVIQKLFLFGVFLAIRPSVEKKTYTYFNSYFSVISRLAAFIAFTLLFDGAVMVGLAGLRHVIETTTFGLWLASLASLLSLSVAYPWLPVFGIYLPMFSFMVFFFFDARQSLCADLMSIIRAGKMMIYNYPFCIVWSCLISAVLFIFLRICTLLSGACLINSGLIGGVPHNVLKYSLVLIAPAVISLWANFYTKRLHDQFNLYFPKK